VSVVLPFNNLDGFLNLAVESILASSFTDFELLLVADGLDLHTSQVHIKGTSDSRVRLVRSNGSGLVSALNTGWHESRGSLIARMDGDDICHPNRLALQIEFLENHPETIAVGSNVNFICRHGNHLGKSSFRKKVARFWMLKPFSSPVAHPTVLIRKSFSSNADPYRQIYPEFQAEDFDLWNRVLRTGEIRNLNKSLLQYRLHDDQVSSRKAKQVYESAQGAVLLDIHECLGERSDFPNMYIGRSELVERLKEPEAMRRLTLRGRSRAHVFLGMSQANRTLIKLGKFLVNRQSESQNPNSFPRVRFAHIALGYLLLPLVSLKNFGNAWRLVSRHLNQCAACHKSLNSKRASSP